MIVGVCAICVNTIYCVEHLFPKLLCLCLQCCIINEDKQHFLLVNHIWDNTSTLAQFRSKIT